jgi:hypothetical protein
VSAVLISAASKREENKRSMEFSLSVISFEAAALAKHAPVRCSGRRRRWKPFAQRSVN